MSKSAICRHDFLKSMTTAGLTYSQARVAYDSFCEVISQAVIDGRRVNLGEVLAIHPHVAPPRKVVSNIPGRNRVVHLTSRIRYVVRLFPAWTRKHSFRWLF